MLSVCTCEANEWAGEKAAFALLQGWLSLGRCVEVVRVRLAIAAL